MRKLVTGATGLLGNNVVRSLCAAGEAVRVLVRENADPRPLAGLNVEVACGDIRDEQSVRQACRGIDVVIHSAAVVHFGWTGMDLQRAVNVEGTRIVASAARSAGARMIHVSSVDALALGKQDQPADEETRVEGRKVECPYVVTKREAEQVVLSQVQDGLDAVIVNPGFMLGPWDWKPSTGRMLLQVGRRFTPFAPRGGMCVCDVRDVADATLAAMKLGQTARRYILAGHNITVLELWRLMGRVTGSRGPWLRPGPVAPHIAGMWGDLRTWVTGHEGDVNSAAVKASSQFHYYSSRRAETELGYRQRPVEQSIQDAWMWFQEHGYA